MSAPLLSVRGLGLALPGGAPLVEAVCFDIAPGEVVGLVGESGSGKTLTLLSLLGLGGAGPRVVAGQALFEGQDLLALPPAALRQLRGGAIGMAFQQARAALNPVRPVGRQIEDVLARHHPAPAAVTRARMLDLLRQMQVADPARRAAALPFQLSGGLCQRIGLAVALAGGPRLLLADEPTTGLDVVAQAAVLAVLRRAVAARGAAALLVTHDLALALQHCDRVLVMHAGHLVEDAPAAALLAAPRHPYTAALLRGMPSAADRLEDLHPVPGEAPDPRAGPLPPCRFAPRCCRRAPVCDTPGLVAVPCGEGRRVACRLPL